MFHIAQKKINIKVKENLGDPQALCPLNWHFSLPFQTTLSYTQADEKKKKNGRICFIFSLIKYKHISIDIKLIVINYKLIDLMPMTSIYISTYRIYIHNSILYNIIKG